MGKVTVDECTPDHSWPTGPKIWYESHLSCPACAKTYSVRQIGNQFAWVRLAVLKAKDAELEAVYDVGRKMDACKSVVEAKGMAIQQLKQARTGAACHRILSQAGIEDRTYRAFQRGWTGPETYINSISRYFYPRLLKIVGSDTAEFDALDAQCEALKAKHEALPATVGEPIYTIPRNRFLKD
jgi:hypothetical protein